jgi:hypothetical protein
MVDASNSDIPYAAWCWNIYHYIFTYKTGSLEGVKSWDSYSSPMQNLGGISCHMGIMEFPSQPHGIL